VDTYLAIASRRDERKYRSDPLPASVAERILDAGRLSGSARNRQPWAFVIPATPERVAAVARTVYAPDNVTSAGLVVAVVVTGGASAAFDAGRAAQNMLLAAWNEGVSSCPNGIDDRDGAAAALGLGDGEFASIVLSFGFPEGERDPEARTAREWSERANRRSLAEVVRHVGGASPDAGASVG
jgi:nitroreductase